MTHLTLKPEDFDCCEGVDWYTRLVACMQLERIGHLVRFSNRGRLNAAIAYLMTCHGHAFVIDNVQGKMALGLSPEALKCLWDAELLTADCGVAPVTEVTPETP